MLLTLLKALNTTDLLKVVSHLGMASIDIDLLLYEAQANGEVEIDKAKGKIKALKEPDTLWYNSELANKFVRIIKEYDRQEANITRSRLEIITLDPQGRYGYPPHEFVCTIYALEQGIVGIEKPEVYEITVPEIKGKRPFHRFKFYTYTDHQEFGAKAVNEFMEQFEQKKKTK